MNTTAWLRLGPGGKAIVHGTVMNDRLHQALWYKSPRDYAKIARNSKLLVA